MTIVMTDEIKEVLQNCLQLLTIGTFPPEDVELKTNTKKTIREMLTLSLFLAAAQCFLKRIGQLLSCYTYLSNIPDQ